MRTKIIQTKRKILVLAIVSLMVLSSLFTVSGSYAYWSSNVSNTSTGAVASVTIGEWNQIFQWDSNTTYSQGDIVERNGTLYEARDDDPFFNPGGFLGFLSWIEL